MTKELIVLKDEDIAKLAKGYEVTVFRKDKAAITIMSKSIYEKLNKDIEE